MRRAGVSQSNAGTILVVSKNCIEKLTKTTPSSSSRSAGGGRRCPQSAEAARPGRWVKLVATMAPDGTSRTRRCHQRPPRNAWREFE
jgi:hypothetical protein